MRGRSILIIIGTLLILISVPGLIPHVSADYNAVSTVFILGFVLIVFGLIRFRKNKKEEYRENVSLKNLKNLSGKNSSKVKKKKA